jgi:hypothetical protein
MIVRAIAEMPQILKRNFLIKRTILMQELGHHYEITNRNWKMRLPQLIDMIEPIVVCWDGVFPLTGDPVLLFFDWLRDRERFY